jgi:hypothetical protein
LFPEATSLEFRPIFPQFAEEKRNTETGSNIAATVFLNMETNLNVHFYEGNLQDCRESTSLPPLPSQCCAGGGG